MVFRGIMNWRAGGRSPLRPCLSLRRARCPRRAADHAREGPTAGRRGRRPLRQEPAFLRVRGRPKVAHTVKEGSAAVQICGRGKPLPYGGNRRCRESAGDRRSPLRRVLPPPAGRCRPASPASRVKEGGAGRRGSLPAARNDSLLHFVHI